MKRDIKLKNEVHQAIYFALALLFLSLPLSILGIKLLNYFLMNVPV